MSKTLITMYKNGLSKTQYKNKMRMFWTKKWKYQKTLEEWVDDLFPEETKKANFVTNQHHYVKYKWPSPYEKQISKDLLNDAVDKLTLEKKFTKDQSDTVKKMLASSKEDAYVALVLMKSAKPKKFKKNE